MLECLIPGRVIVLVFTHETQRFVPPFHRYSPPIDPVCITIDVPAAHFEVTEKPSSDRLDTCPARCPEIHI